MCDRELAIDILLLSRMDVRNWKKVLEFKVHCWKLMKRQPVFPFLRKIPSEAFVAYSQKIG